MNFASGRCLPQLVPRLHICCSFRVFEKPFVERVLRMVPACRYSVGKGKRRILVFSLLSNLSTIRNQKGHFPSVSTDMDACLEMYNSVGNLNI